MTSFKNNIIFAKIGRGLSHANMYDVINSNLFL